jgi:hypothetical protein
MSRDLVIQVNVNPNSSGGPTETQETTNVVSQQTMTKGAAQAAQAKQAMSLMARQAYNFALSNIGELTGNSSLERRLQAANQVSNIAAIATQNPYAAVAMVAMQVGIGAASTAIENRNQQIENDYNRKLKVNTYNNNRRT